MSARPVRPLRPAKDQHAITFSGVIITSSEPTKSDVDNARFHLKTAVADYQDKHPGTGNGQLRMGRTEANRDGTPRGKVHQYDSDTIRPIN